MEENSGSNKEVFSCHGQKGVRFHLHLDIFTHITINHSKQVLSTVIYCYLVLFALLSMGKDLLNHPKTISVQSVEVVLAEPGDVAD